MTSISKFLDREHENHISHGDKKDRFAFMKTRIRILRVRGEFYSAQRYGLTYLAWYEQELVRLYEKILTDKKILKSTKKHLISVVLAKILIREIEWFIIIDQQKIIEQFFTYWKDQFQKLLASYEDPRAENISVGL